MEQAQRNVMLFVLSYVELGIVLDSVRQKNSYGLNGIFFGGWPMEQGKLLIRPFMYVRPS